MAGQFVVNRDVANAGVGSGIHGRSEMHAADEVEKENGFTQLAFGWVFKRRAFTGDVGRKRNVGRRGLLLAGDVASAGMQGQGSSSVICGRQPSNAAASTY